MSDSSSNATANKTVKKYVDGIASKTDASILSLNEGVAELQSLIDTLNPGYQFMGVATPEANPGTPDQKVFYIANGKGTYTNFGGIEVTEDEVVILYYDTTWHKLLTGIASQEKLSELETKVTDLHEAEEIRSKGVVEKDVTEDATVVLGKFKRIDGVETASPAWSYRTLSVRQGQKYRITAFAGQNARLWMFLNGQTIVSYSDDSSPLSMKEEIVAIPNGVDNLLVNAIVDTLDRQNAVSIHLQIVGVNFDDVFVGDNIRTPEYIKQNGIQATENLNMTVFGVADTPKYPIFQSGCTNSSNRLVYNREYLYSQPILLKAGETITYKAGKTLYNAVVRVADNSPVKLGDLLSGQVLISYTNTNIVSTYTATEDTYIIVFVFGESYEIHFQKTQEDSILDQMYSFSEMLFKSKSNELGVYGANITDTAIVVPNYYKNIYGGDSGPYDGWNYLKFPVYKGYQYKVTASAGMNAKLWLLLSNETVVSYYDDSSAPSVKEDTVTIPEGVDTLVVNTNNLSVVSVVCHIPGIDAKSVFVNQTVNIKEYVDSKTNELLYKSNRLYGKVLVCAGDSITQGVDMDAEGITDSPKIDTYQSDTQGVFTKQTSAVKMVYGYQIAARNNMVFYNAGISGSTMQGISEKNGFSLENGRYTKLPDNLDYLTLFFGWNDTAYGTLGTINDETNESYYGAYNVVMPYLINKYPFAKIALIVPFGTDEGHRNAIRELSNKWGVACFDMYQSGTPLYYGKETSVNVNASIVAENQAKFQAKGAHPNFKGHRQIGDMLEHFLRGI